MQLVIEDVGKQYAGRGWALDGVTLTLTPGLTGLLGPNGAGKSTLMRILAALTRPTRGRVLWDGADLARQPDRLRAVLGYLPQDFGIYPHLTAVEFLDYIAAAKGLDPASARRRITALLEMVGLVEPRHRPLGGYSGGMRQRVGIAQALLNDPQLLIVDEPTAGLDPEERVRFRNLLLDLAGTRIVLLSTHIVSDIEAAAERIAVLAEGRLIADGTPEALLDSAAGHVWEVALTPDQLTTFRERHRVGTTQRRGDSVVVRVVSDDSPHPHARPSTPTLEDAYLWHLDRARSTARV